MKLLACLSAVFALLPVFLCAQNSADVLQQSANILPPSPTAFALGKYGLNTIGLSTGTASVDIPLHTYRTKNVEVPISLSYSSNGVKVDEIGSWVGLSWSLSAGGVITRIIRDEADVPNPYPYPSNFHADNPEALEYLQLAGEDTNFDSEQDQYAFNFMGHTGKFMYDRAGGFVVLPYKNIKIERLMDASSPSGGYFQITTEDGIQYYFGIAEYSKTRSIGPSCGKTYDVQKETSWYLTRVTHPQGDVVDFNYSPYSHRYVSSLSQTVTQRIGEQQTCSTTTGSCFTNSNSICQSELIVEGVRLLSITSNGNYGSVLFDATQDRADVQDMKLNSIVVNDKYSTQVKSFSFQYVFSHADAFGNEFSSADPSLTKRMFLSTVWENNSTNTPLRQHVFEYDDIDALPPRLSFSQDHWGYFNGAANPDLVPADLTHNDDEGRKLFVGIGGSREPNAQYSKKGLLKRVTYPTGGVSSIFFEPHTYRGMKTIEPPPTPLQLTVKGKNLFTMDYKSFDFFNVTLQDMPITIASFWEPEDGAEYMENHHFGTLSVADLTTGQMLINSRHITPGEPFSTFVILEKDHQYRVEVGAAGKYIGTTLTASYVAESATQEEANIEVGGLRVSRIENFDAVTGKTETIGYKYARLDNLHVSSGNARGWPIYFARSSVLGEVSCTNGQGQYTVKRFCYYGSLHSSSVSSLYPVNGNHVYYENVTVTRGTDVAFGAEQHTFRINFDAPGPQVWGEDILSAPFSNKGWDNGLELATDYYKNQLGKMIPVKRVANVYVTDVRNGATVKNLVVRRKYDPAFNSPAVITCTTANSEDASWPTGTTCTAQHAHKWLISSGEGGFCIAGGAQNVVTVVPNYCYNKANQTITLPWTLDHLDAVEYNNTSYWFYLQSTTETFYDDAGQNPVTVQKEFLYDNPLHTFLSRIRTSRSDGKTTETSMKYLGDYAIGTENLSILKEKNIIGSPLRTDVTVDNLLTQGTVIRLSNVGQPLAIYKYESATGAAPPAHNGAQLLPSASYKLKGTLTYNTDNNLVQVSTTNSPRIAYVWGYDETKVIAKVTNADPAQVFYTGFEENGTAGPAQTGERYLNSGSFTITTQMFNPAQTTGLMMSYWFWNNNTWNFSGELSFNRVIAQGQKLDELRVYPKGALLQTIAYNTHFDQVKSVTDENNHTMQYEYDGAGRLIRVKDHNNNIVSESKYHYYNTID